MNCLVPVVLGPTLEEAQDHFPSNSFIHVDNFTDVAKLAEWLKYLDMNPEAYR